MPTSQAPGTEMDDKTQPGDQTIPKGPARKRTRRSAAARMRRRKQRKRRVPGKRKKGPPVK